jgi:putative redox protein
MSDNEIKITFGEGLKVDVDVKGFTVKTDQPVNQGGTNEAPTPFDYFLASMAACSGFYALAFCKERQIPYDKIAMVMRTEKGEVSKMVDKVTIEVNLPPEFPDHYKFALGKAIEHCTVKLHIMRPPQFETIITKN